MNLQTQVCKQQKHDPQQKHAIDCLQSAGWPLKVDCNNTPQAYVRFRLNHAQTEGLLVSGALK